MKRKRSKRELKSLVEKTIKRVVGGTNLISLDSFEEAASYPDGVVIIQSDISDQIYVIAQAAKVCCSGEVLKQLITDLDSMVSPPIRSENPSDLVTGVPGNTAGDLFAQEPWIHADLLALGLGPSILAVLRGERQRLGCHVI